MPEAAGEAGRHHEELNLTPPAEGFELYLHKNADETKVGGCTGPGATSKATTRSGP